MVAKTIEESLASGNPFVIDCRYVPKNGKVRYANIICRVELDDIGKPRWMHGTFQDITERKAAEEATRKANAELEHEVQKRTFELVQTNEPLKHEIGERRQAEQELLAYQAKPRTLSSELSLTEERERRRIATEQHDRIGQTLAFTKIKLGELQKASPSKSAAKVVEEIRQFIEQTIQDTRSLTFELSPPVLYDLGLEAAVEGFTNKVKKQYGLAIEFYDDELPKPLNEGVRVFIYQAIRELLFNITRHAKAVSAKVSIRREGENIVVDIGDDGVGFDKHFQNCM
jgi:signal transduction histidine kinase